MHLFSSKNSQSVSPSVRQSVSPSVRQSVSPSVRQSVSPSVRQNNSEHIDQPSQLKNLSPAPEGTTKATGFQTQQTAPAGPSRLPAINTHAINPKITIQRKGTAGQAVADKLIKIINAKNQLHKLTMSVTAHADNNGFVVTGEGIHEYVPYAIDQVNADNHGWYLAAMSSEDTHQIEIEFVDQKTKSDQKPEKFSFQTLTDFPECFASGYSQPTSAIEVIQNQAIISYKQLTTGGLDTCAALLFHCNGKNFLAHVDAITSADYLVNQIRNEFHLEELKSICPIVVKGANLLGRTRGVTNAFAINTIGIALERLGLTDRTSYAGEVVFMTTIGINDSGYFKSN